ncbi:MAG: hypothetical protein VR72_00150 [Clostridiaceae bacterium BRH_c20a]|nr:MAG: hypothetical protein VR72_00150 [Clostridiaceae bacterium BRH_c20a]
MPEDIDKQNIEDISNQKKVGDLNIIENIGSGNFPTKNIYSRSLVRTVSTLRDKTNNIRTFANGLEEFLDSIERFTPHLEMLLRGGALLLGGTKKKIK